MTISLTKFQCFNNYGCRFFHPFPTDVAQQARLNGWIPQSEHKLTPSTSHRKPIPPRHKSQTPQQANASRTCPGCFVCRSNTSCRNELRCKSCCLALGGCVISAHSSSEETLESSVPSSSVPSSPAEHPSHGSSPIKHLSYRQRSSLPGNQFLSSTTSPSHHLPRRSLPNSRTGHINVITQQDVTRVMPRSRVPTNLALIDMTLEELEADEPEWDLVFGGTTKRRLESPLDSPPAKRKRPLTPASSPSSPCISSQQSVAHNGDWPSGLTVTQMSAGFTRIFSEDALSLSPSRRFEAEFGGKWDPLVFYLHYDLWKGMSEVDREIGERSDSEWVAYVQHCELLL